LSSSADNPHFEVSGSEVYAIKIISTITTYHEQYYVHVNEYNASFRALERKLCLLVGSLEEFVFLLKCVSTAGTNVSGISVKIIKLKEKKEGIFNVILTYIRTLGTACHFL
jgi:hypothetical protein